MASPTCSSATPNDAMALGDSDYPGSPSAVASAHHRPPGPQDLATNHEVVLSCTDDASGRSTSTCGRRDVVSRPRGVTWDGTDKFDDRLLTGGNPGVQVRRRRRSTVSVECLGPIRSPGSGINGSSPVIPILRVRKRHYCAAALLVIGSAAGLGIVRGVPAPPVAHAACFQQGGYNPPPCTPSTPTTDSSQTPSSTSGTPPGGNQNAPGSPPASQSSTDQDASTPPDAGITACQNQSAMAIAIGLQPTTCRPTNGPNTPPDSGVTACQHQNAMSNVLGLQPAACPPSARG